MRLDKNQFTQAQSALLGGFDRDDLRLMVRLQLDEDLDTITSNDELDVLVFNLLTWAEREDRLSDLIQGALAANPGNRELQHLAEDYGKWQEDNLLSAGTQQKAALSAHSDPASVESRRRPATVLNGTTGLIIAALIVTVAVLLIVAFRPISFPQTPVAASTGIAPALPAAGPALAFELATSAPRATEPAATQSALATYAAKPTVTPTEPPTTPSPTEPAVMQASLATEIAEPTVTPAELLPALSSTQPATGTVREFGGVSFVYVPAGDFQMGITETQITSAVNLCSEYWQTCKRADYEDERSQHFVDLDGFWIMRTEVTNELWQRFMDDGGYDQARFWSNDGWRWLSDNAIVQPGCWTNPVFNAGDRPVVCVNWYEAEAFARWFSEEAGREEGHEIRLPTEAEWEMAARGSSGYTFPWGNNFDSPKRANYCDGKCEDGFRTRKDNTDDDGYKYTAPVGSYPDGASPYGALDMAGNVWEWVADWYADAYGSAPAVNPTGPTSGWGRVVRGGSWTRIPDNLRTSHRHGEFMDRRTNDLGLRLVVPGF